MSTLPPTIIVLDTFDAMEQLFNDYGNVLSLLKRGTDERTSFDTLIDAMVNEQDALMNLGQLAQELADEVSDTTYGLLLPDDLRINFYDFGKYIYRELLQHRLYQHGYLQYSYHGWLSGYLMIRHNPHRPKGRSVYEKTLRVW